MKFFVRTAALISFAAIFYLDLGAQTLAPTPATSDALLESLTKKIDEQNAKIDALSQQILKLEQQLSKPGVPIGEATPPPSSSAPVNGAATTPAATSSGNAHIVARGETLTSIAKANKVSVDELQKFNHIENPLKLQIGQTINIPPSANPTPAPSATSPNE